MPAHDSRVASGAATGPLPSAVAIRATESVGSGFGSVDRHVL
jgi:hypothetical protein